ncbi:ABC transporter permease [Desulfonema ishimotonii]|uniref:ABC transporter permease n=1 Tax=Desulfonema ishimotonii TaxID=45657 RepID=A0A401FTU1_9BACT|nr:ABC transporter permease subunit [Desulfonema ishimotonii]GBC60381.1 ABC transporter permease [Desulfonema ishimotonii]
MKSVLISQIWALALNVWREASRDRLVHILASGGVLLMFFSLVLGELSVGGQLRIVQTTGFLILGMWGLLAVIYLGSEVLKREIQRKTVYLVLSRPVSRSTFLAGKFFGMLLVLATLYCLLACSWLIMLKFKAIPVTHSHFWALLFIWGEWILLAALSLFFASFTSPLLHNFFLISIYFFGHWSSDLKIFSENAENLWLKKFLILLYYALPNLEALNFRAAALYSEPVSMALLAEAVLVLTCWIATALMAANYLFIRRKLL